MLKRNGVRPRTAGRPASPRLSAVVRGVLWMTVTVLCFASMSVAGRELSATMSTFEILFWRSLVGVAAMLPLALHEGGRAVATRRPGAHFVRNIVHFSGQFGFFYGIALLPLAQVTALGATMPIFGALMAAIALGERFDLRRAVVIGLGFLGVLLILRPGWVPVGIPALVVLAGSAAYAWSSIMVKALTRTESAIGVVFYMMLMQMPMALIPAVLDWSGGPAWADLPWILLVGVTGLLAHYSMTKALALADVAVVLPVNFLQLPFIAFVAFLMYGEVPALATLVGGGLIFAATYYGVRRETRRPQPAAAAKP